MATSTRRAPATKTQDGHVSTQPQSRSLLKAGIAGVTVALAIAGCTSAPSTPVQIDHAEAPPGDVVAQPEPADVMLDSALSHLPGLVTNALEGTGVPGAAVAVVHDDRTVFSEGFGVRDVTTGQPVTPDTVFQVASMSKPLSATAVALAIDEDPRLSWDSRIADLLPTFSLSDPFTTERATIADAFSHQTGIPTGLGDDLEDIGYEAQEIFTRLAAHPLEGLRTGYRYSNYGLTLGAQAVAAARDQAWEDVMNDLVFAPLDMTGSSSVYSDFMEHDNRAMLHSIVEGEFVTGSERDPTSQSPAGGVSSTVADIATWMGMILESAAGGSDDDRNSSVTTAMSGHVVRSPAPPLWRTPLYGYGFNVDTLPSGRTLLSHSGGFELGAATNVQFVPSLDVAIVTLTNGAPIGVPEAINSAFVDILQFGDVTRDWVPTMREATAELTEAVGDLVGQVRPPDADPPPTADLTGRYTNPYYGDLIVSRRSDEYIVALGPDAVTESTLLPWDGVTFAYAPRNENAPDGSLASATFAVNSSGTVTSVRLDTFDTHALGTWERADDASPGQG
ncbi:serine hydrolase [Demequina flava]|uniref:serine hydrolase n=1 Tax=Demequina flava TaxID=1095025 RepID=UPI000784CD28|nr:serine hydrolase [Demequina flava]